MLKIKDNIDLKELEKYGFKLDDFPDIFFRYTYRSGANNLNVNEFRELSVFPTHYDRLDVGIMNKLYDLIKANLVEKVDDSN